jgi:hypothetical protein
VSTFAMYNVQAFHDKGKDGVRVLMYEEMAKRLGAPLHIHSCNNDGQPLHTAAIYGKDQAGEPVRLIRENTDLYRRCARHQRGDLFGCSS